jgi:hypothetical protein
MKPAATTRPARSEELAGDIGGSVQGEAHRICEHNQSTWPHVVQRNQSFISASLTARESCASKQSLAVEIFDKLDRGNLQMQAKGGSRSPRGGSNIAVPASTIPKTSRGVPTALLPKTLPPDQSFKRGDVLYSKNKKTRRLRLLYVLKRDTKIPRRVPFYEDFSTSMQRELHRTMPMAVAKALATRKR